MEQPMSRLAEKIEIVRAELAEVEAELAEFDAEIAKEPTRACLHTRGDILSRVNDARRRLANLEREEAKRIRCDAAVAVSRANDEVRRRAAESARRSEAKSTAEGGRRFPGSVMPPEAVAALESLVNAGYAANKTLVLVRALLEAVDRQRAVD